MSRITQALVLSIVVTLAESQNPTPWKGPNHLHPVHGLYVKPSVDGTTGDLYVAATEDSGTKTQWLTDQPVSFLPVGAATQQQSTAVPLPFTSSYSASNHDEIQMPQKRAVVASPPVQYAYALPASGAEGAAMTYPYAIPAVATSQASSSETSSIPQCTDANGAIHYNPYQFFYPQMMSAYAKAMSVLKESGMSDDKAGAVVSQASPMWSPYNAYPMYVMMDPSAWAQPQVQTSTPTSSNES